MSKVGSASTTLAFWCRTRVGYVVPCVLTGTAGALWLIGFRVVQAVWAAMLMANSTAILTDSFPLSQRGMALGVNQVAAIAGSSIGLVVGGF